jgi:hypothetical protein
VSAQVGDIPVEVHLATAAPLSVFGQRLFDELRWRNLVTVVSVSKIASADAVTSLAKYVGLLRQKKLRGFVFKLATPSAGKYVEIRAAVVAELRGFRVLLGGDFLSRHQPMQVALMTDQGSFIQIKGGTNIPPQSQGGHDVPRRHERDPLRRRHRHLH